MIANAKNPVWVDEEKKILKIEVESTTDGKWHTLMTAANNSVPEEVMLYNLAVNGYFGAIASKPDPTPEELYQTALQTAEAQYARRLAEINTAENQAIVNLDPQSAQAQSIKAKLSALLAVKQQEEWPYSPVWPD